MTLPTSSCLSIVLLALSVSAASAQQPRAESVPPAPTSRSQFVQRATELSADLLTQSQAARARYATVPSITVPKMTLPPVAPPTPDVARSAPAPLGSRPGS